MVGLMERLRARTKADLREEAAEAGRIKGQTETLLTAFESASAEAEEAKAVRSTAERSVAGLAGLANRTPEQELDLARREEALLEATEQARAASQRKLAAASALHRHHEEVHEAENAAELVRQAEADTSLAAFVPRLDAAFREVEALAAEALNLLAAREKAWPEKPVIIAKNGPTRIMGTGRPGWDGRKAVLLGGGDPHVGVGQLFNAFRNDPNAGFGGPVGLFRSLAEEAGLLPMSDATKLRLAEERQRNADALVRNALADGWTHRRLASVWGGVARDLSMGGK